MFKREVRTFLIYVLSSDESGWHGGATRPVYRAPDVYACSNPDLQ